MGRAVFNGARGALNHGQRSAHLLLVCSWRARRRGSASGAACLRDVRGALSVSLFILRRHSACARHSAYSPCGDGGHPHDLPILLAPRPRVMDQTGDPAVAVGQAVGAHGEVHRRARDDEPEVAPAEISFGRRHLRHVAQRQHHLGTRQLILGVRKRATSLVDGEVALRPLTTEPVRVLVAFAEPAVQRVGLPGVDERRRRRCRQR